MYIIINIIIPLIVGFLGVFAGIWYSAYVSYRQEKAILVLLIREFTLLINRTTMYYEQYLNNEISYSTLFSISDSSTFIKLAEVTKNKEIVEAALKLKADFFQVIRHADEASELLNQNKGVEALNSQSKALVFFLGDVYSKDEFKRIRYKRYLERVNFLLNYLHELNSPTWFNKCIIYICPSFRKEKITTDNSISKFRKDIDERSNELDTFREIEKLREQKKKLEKK